MAASGGSKKVYVGDGGKRVRIRMPTSLAKCLAKVKQVYNVDDAQLWLDATMGRRPAQGTELVATESDYRCIIDEDAVVFVSGDQILHPNDALLAAFDATTTYNTDYVEKPLPERRQPYEGTRKYPTVAPQEYSTTYGRDYVKRDPFASEELPEGYYGEPPTEFAGNTTYRRDYVEYPLTSKQGDDRPKHFRPRAAPAPRVLTTTNRAHYKGAMPRALGRPNHTPLEEPPEGAKWRPTEYAAKYNEYPLTTKAAKPPPEEWAVDGPPPPNGNTTYKRDYVPMPSVTPLLNVEPCSETLNY